MLIWNMSPDHSSGLSSNLFLNSAWKEINWENLWEIGKFMITIISWDQKKTFSCVQIHESLDLTIASYLVFKFKKRLPMLIFENDI